MAYHAKRLIDWGDCDAAGIVFYPNFFRWMDSVFHELSTDLGFGHKDLNTHGVFAIPLRDVGAKFISPASYSTFLDIEARVSRLGESSFQMRYAISHNGRAVAEGHEDRVCVKQVMGGMSKTPIPDAIRAHLQALHG